jgi:acetamidase/formamidase
MPEFSLDQYHLLVARGIIAPVELADGRVMMGDYELAFSSRQVAAAAELGVYLVTDTLKPAPAEEVPEDVASVHSF